MNLELRLRNKFFRKEMSFIWKNCPSTSHQTVYLNFHSSTKSPTMLNATGSIQATSKPPKAVTYQNNYGKFDKESMIHI